MNGIGENNGVRTCPISWTDDIFDEFRKRYGYDVRPLLPEIFYRPNGEKMGKVRIDCIDLCCNLFNEAYAIDIGRKIKAQQRQLMKNGKFVGARTPFGYVKAADDCHQLILDPAAAVVVQKIFRWAADRTASALSASSPAPSTSSSTPKYLSPSP